VESGLLSQRGIVGNIEKFAIRTGTQNSTWVKRPVAGLGRGGGGGDRACFQGSEQV